MRLFFRSSLILGVLILVACNTSPQSNNDPKPAQPVITKVAVVATPNPTPIEPTPVSITVYDRYIVRNGDTLGAISARYNISLDDLMKVNGLTNPNSLLVGQQLKIPSQVSLSAPGDKLLPDSELVYSPAFASFDVNAVANQSNGYLNSYRDKVEGEMLTGAEIVQLVAERFSVGPRVLLALLEYQSNWVTGTVLTQNQISYPMGLIDPTRQGLFYQISWAANHLNEGYYGKITGQLVALKFKNGLRARLASTANPGTVAIQNILAINSTWEQWQGQIGNDGFIATYRKLFGDPGQYAIEPLIPADLKQPTLRLPWSDGELWYYTGGPHSAWGDLATWSAVDFTPADVAGAGTCVPSRTWAIAAAPGKILRSEHGRVIESLSNSDFIGNGWTLLYMHMAPTGRVSSGMQVNVGDRVGHPSCEGGNADASHLHLARLYNGQWMGAEFSPMVLSGWTILPLAQDYNGTMARGTDTREACNCRDNVKNGIIADKGQ